MQAPTGESTRLLGKVRAEDEAARANLSAAMMRRERPGHSPQATELLHVAGASTLMRHTVMSRNGRRGCG